MPYTQVPVGNQFIRNFPVPLDRDFVFNTTEARNNYLTDAATSGIAYTGMIVADLETNRAYLLNSSREWVQVGEQINDIFGSSNSGILIKTGDNTFTVGGLEQGTNISISNPSGLAGNPVINVVSSLSGLNSVAITGSANDALSITGGASVGGTLSANSGDFSGGVTIGGDLIVSGSSVSFDSATITLVNLAATSGNFADALTVGGTGVSLEGHGHVWDDIDISGSGFCEDVGDCVNTQIVGSSGVQLIYSSGNNTLRVALSGEALAQHLLSSTGFVARSGSETYVTRTITGGSNIGVTNGDGLLGNPTVALSGTVTGLTSVTATTFSGALSGNASSASQVKTQSSSSSNEHYLTFVDFNNASATNETVYTASGIKYIPSTDTLIVGNLSGVTIDGTASEADTVKTLTKSDGGTYYLTFVDGDNNSPGAYEAVYTDAGIVYDPSTNALTLTGDITASGATINNNLVVGGDLTVNGTTITANVDSMIIEDPIIVLGKPSGTIGAENKDRGIEFVYPSGSSTVAATGFFGFDKSATEFIAARDVTINNEIVTVNNNSYLDARFKDIDGATITAGTEFSGPGSGLSGHASNLTVAGADHLNGGSGGSLAYQSSADVTTFLDIGNSGQFLRVNNAGQLPEWYTLSYTDIGGIPTIGSGTLTLAVSGVGLSGSASFNANQTDGSTFTVISNATSANTNNTIVSRDGSGNFSAGIITASLDGNASTVTNGVYTTGNQNIDGVKTFTDIIVSNSGLNSYNSSSFYLNLGTNASNTFGVYYADGDGEGGSILLRPAATPEASTTIVGQATTDIELLLPTSSGTLALISDIAVSNLTGTLPVNKGGTGAPTLTGALIGNGTSAVSGVASTTPYALFRVNDAGNGYEFSTVIDGGTP